MKKLTLWALLLTLIASFSFASTADYKDGSTVSALYSQVGVGAAGAGMANAYTGACNDSTSVFWNPAGLASMKKNEKDWNMFFAHNVWLADSMIDNLSVAKSFKNYGVVGLGVSYYNAGGMDYYEISSSGEPVDLNRKFSVYSIGVNLAYSNALDKDIDFGVTLKYLLDVIDNDAANAFSFDLGLRYNFQPLKGLSFNLVARNFGGQLSDFIMAKGLTLGLLYSLQLENWNVAAAYDIEGNVRSAAVHRIGIEVKSPYMFTLRCGYFTYANSSVSGFKNISTGIGMNLDDKHIDFAYEPYGDLGNVFKVSFGSNF